VPRKQKESKDNTTIIVAIIAGAVTLITAIIGLVTPFVNRIAEKAIPISTPTFASEPIVSPTTIALLPEPTATPDNIIFFDDFSTNKGIPVWNEENSFGEIVDGVYRFGAMKPYWAFWRSYKALKVSDFRARVDINVPNSSHIYSCGMIFRSNDEGKYFFGINNDNRFEFVKHTLNHDTNEMDDTTIVDWEANMAIETRGVNTIEVAAQSDTFELFVNGVKLKTVVDPSHKNGEIGFYVSTYGGGQEVIVEFDNLIIEEY